MGSRANVSILRTCSVVVDRMAPPLKRKASSATKSALWLSVTAAWLWHCRSAIPIPSRGLLYPDSLKDWAKKDARFTQMVHDKLFELVQLAKQTLGKMRSRSYSFDPMNRDKRQFIHEYSVFFGCESASYDEEPKRNVVATAYGETSFLPAVSVVDVARREMGQRKMPAPPSMKGAAPAVAFAPPQPQQVQQPKPSAVAWGTRTMSDVVKSTAITKPPVVDYFDFTS